MHSITGIKEPKEKIRLYKALRLGYTRDPERQKRGLKKYGYVFDPELSSRERMVAYNPIQKKLLFVDNGTDPSNLEDIEADIVLGTAGIKHTKRYEDDHKALVKAQQKYHPTPNHTILAGHSLGGALINALAPKGSQAYTFDAAIGPRETREDILHLRTKGDVVSALAPSEKIVTLKNNNFALPITPITNTLKAHNLTNVADQPVFF